MCAELSQPGGIGDVTLTAGQVLHVPGVDQHHLESDIFEQVVERLPVIPSGLHHHQTDLFVDQMLPKRQDRIRRRRPGAYRLHCLAATLPGDPDADLRIPFGYIHPCTPAMHDFHDRLPPICVEAGNHSTRGGPRQIRSLTRVLEATIHGSRGDPPHHAD
jgi:hypothetical protein